MLVNPRFIVPFLLFLGHQLAQKALGFHQAFIDSYLDPLLLMPILLHLILWERRYLFDRGADYQLPLSDIILILILVSVLTEHAFPLWNDAFTADQWDLFCYFTGSLFFYLCQPPGKPTSPKTAVKRF